MNPYEPQVRRKAELLELAAKLTARQPALEQEVKKLGILAHNEQADVDNLESSGLKGLLLGILGKKQETLEREQQEARAANQQYTNAKAQLDKLTADLSGISQELNELGNCEENFRKEMPAPISGTVLTAENELAQITVSLDTLASVKLQIDALMKDLTKLLDTSASRPSPSSGAALFLADIDDQLRSIGSQVTQSIRQLKVDISTLAANAATLGIDMDISEITSVADDYLAELYTPALIANRGSGADHLPQDPLAAGCSQGKADSGLSGEDHCLSSSAFAAWMISGAQI